MPILQWIKLSWTIRVLAAFAVLGAAVILWLVRTGGVGVPERLACLADDETRGPHAGMVWVPGGTFEMGDAVYPEEGPLRTVTVEGFWMDRTEVTNAEFAEFVRATAYVTVAERNVDATAPPAAVFIMPSGNVDLNDIGSWWRYVRGANWKHPGGPDTSIEGREHMPAVALTYEDAVAYAKWKGRDLPSEAQWEWAARGGKPNVNEHEQPKGANTWQGVFPVINAAEDGFAGLAPVGCFKPNDYGLYDMIGNVWELTAEPYDDQLPKARVIKGGSYLCARNYCLRYRAGARQRQEEDLATSHVGLRTVLNEHGQ